ncbi:MAG: RNA polymerase sigma factor [Pseudomonadales bacterium]
MFSFFKRGSKDSFGRLLDEHIEHLYAIAYRLTGQPANAEDLLQELVIRLFEQSDNISGLANPRAYLVRSLHNLYVDSWRSTKNSPLTNAEDIESLDVLTEEQSSPDQIVNNERLAERLHVALQKLPPERRIMVVLHDIHGYSMPELATMLNLPLGTIKSRLHRARAALRLELNWEPLDEQLRLPY